MGVRTAGEVRRSNRGDSTGARPVWRRIRDGRGEAEKFLATLQERSKQQYVAPFDIALIYVGFGNLRATFEWLDKAYEDRSTWLTWITLDPRFEGIRDDARYRDLLQRMKIAD